MSRLAASSTAPSAAPVATPLSISTRVTSSTKSGTPSVLRMTSAITARGSGRPLARPAFTIASTSSRSRRPSGIGATSPTGHGEVNSGRAVATSRMRGASAPTRSPLPTSRTMSESSSSVVGSAQWTSSNAITTGRSAALRTSRRRRMSKASSFSRSGVSWGRGQRGSSGSESAAASGGRVSAGSSPRRRSIDSSGSPIAAIMSAIGRSGLSCCSATQRASNQTSAGTRRRSSRTRRDLPIPGSPVTSTAPPRPACIRRQASRSWASCWRRPTSGVSRTSGIESRPARGRSSPVTRNTGRARESSGRRCSPAGSTESAPRMSRWVSWLARISPGCASSCSRVATCGVTPTRSSASPWSPGRGSCAITRPVWMPIRTSSLSRRSAASRALARSTSPAIRSAACDARRASSSRACG